jgi:cytidylate kinase
MTAVTISRQIGSGGDAIAARVCELLDYRYFDKTLMSEVAAEVGLSERELIDYSEDSYTVQSFLDRLFRPGPRTVARFHVAKEETVDETLADVVSHRPRRDYPFQPSRTVPVSSETLTVKELDESTCVRLIRSTVHAAHIAGQVVIVGRGAQAILKDAPDVLHVRVEAPSEERIKRLRKERTLNEMEARQMIMDKDRATAEYLGRFFDIDWENPALYHLILNTGKLSIEAAAQVIACGLRQIKEEPAS